MLNGSFEFLNKNVRSTTFDTPMSVTLRFTQVCRGVVGSKTVCVHVELPVFGNKRTTLDARIDRMKTGMSEELDWKIGNFCKF